MAGLRISGGKDVVECPRCGYRFSISYSRAFACSGCPTAALSCSYVKCPNCGHEFQLRGVGRGEYFTA